MRAALILVLLAIIVSPKEVLAQNEPDRSSHRAIKILAGGAALVVGIVVAAKSSQTTTVSSALGQTETSTFSSSQLATGLGVAGVGGLVLWSGLKDDHRNPSVSFGIAAAPYSRAVMV